jgi:hypothetical protein
VIALESSAAAACSRKFKQHQLSNWKMPTQNRIANQATPDNKAFPIAVRSLQCSRLITQCNPRPQFGKSDWSVAGSSRRFLLDAELAKPVAGMVFGSGIGFEIISSP